VQIVDLHIGILKRETKMVTKSEQQVIDEYKDKGYYNVHSGSVLNVRT